MAASPSISIIGNGGWGAAMAVILAGKEYPVTIWGNDRVYLEDCRKRGENARFLPGVKLPTSLRYEPDLTSAFAKADIVVGAVPTRYLRSVLRRRGRCEWRERACCVSLTKGIEADTLQFPSRIFSEETGCGAVAVLSGPSMAEEVAQGLPAGVVLAHPDLDHAAYLQGVFSTSTFRVYVNPDVIGVELCGAAKNVIAIAAGLCDGMKLGDNAKAALLARGLAELRRMGGVLGARDETFVGLAGVGDLYTTCASPYGRNRGFGERLGRGTPVSEAIANSGGMIVEGVDTAKSLHALALRDNVEMPICEAIYRIIYENAAPHEALKLLMERGLRDEQ